MSNLPRFLFVLSRLFSPHPYRAACRSGVQRESSFVCMARLCLLLGVSLVLLSFVSGTRAWAAGNVKGEGGQARSSVAATFAVTNTDDSGPGSLREAILDANASEGLDLVAFRIPGDGIHTIEPLSALPEITDPVIVDGYTQPGTHPNTLPHGNDAVLAIELNGDKAGAANGLAISAGSSVIRGLIINRFYSGIYSVNGGENVIEGNIIGTNMTSTKFIGNSENGIVLDRSYNNRIGGTTPAARNVISGNHLVGIDMDGANQVVQGNFIGTDVTGQRALITWLDQQGPGVYMGTGIMMKSNHSLIGGAEQGAGNVISGNFRDGMMMLGVLTTDNKIQGNLIGTSADGTKAVANHSYGIQLGAPQNLIGGTRPAERNVISGNEITGIVLWAEENHLQGNYIGTDITGQLPIPNEMGGLDVRSDHNWIGGDEPGAGNVISGNAKHGINVYWGMYLNIQGNIIGLAADGHSPLGNRSAGIYVNTKSRQDNIMIGGRTPGAGNEIAYNSVGVRINTGTSESILGNSIFNNKGMGIDLAPSGQAKNDRGDKDGGTNDMQNYPKLAWATSWGGITRVSGVIATAPYQGYDLDFYGSETCDRGGYGEGQKYLGTINVTTDSQGTAPFVFTGLAGVPQNWYITSTATNDGRSTSEFSACIALSIQENIPAVQYGSWAGIGDAEAHGSSYRVSNKPGATAIIRFTGTKIAWTTRRGPDQGRVAVQLDGVNQGVIDLYDPQPQADIEGFEAPNGGHNLALTVLADANPLASDRKVIVDHFLAYNGATGSGYESEEDGLMITYDGWEGITMSGPSGGARAGSEAGSSFRFAFSGTSINWITALGPLFGQAEVFIDGKSQGVVTLTAGRNKWKVLKTYSGLSEGEHEFEVQVLSKRVIVDGFSGPISAP